MRDARWGVVPGGAFEGSESTPTETQSILRTITSSLGSLYSVKGLAAAIHVAHAAWALPAGLVAYLIGS